MKDENTNLGDGDLMRGSKAPAEIWTSSSKPMPKYSLWQRVKVFGYTALTGASLFLGIYSGCALKDKQQKTEAREAHQKYTVLEELADIDKDGRISDVERILLVERLDKSAGYGYMRYDPLWRDIESRSNFWDHGELNRIRRTIKEYEK